MKVLKQLLPIILFFLFVGCVSDNNQKTSKEVIEKNTNQQEKADVRNKEKQIAANKNSLKNDSTKASEQKKNNNKKATGKKNILNNTKLTVDERMVALRKFDTNISKPDEYELFKKIVQNPKEHLILREAAIKKIYKKSAEDADMLQYLFSVIRGKSFVRFKNYVVQFAIVAAKTLGIFASHARWLVNHPK